jgi:hypothetical protein
MVTVVGGKVKRVVSYILGVFFWTHNRWVTSRLTKRIDCVCNVFYHTLFSRVDAIEFAILVGTLWQQTIKLH